MTLIEKYINPFTDFGFKKLFGTEPNKDLLIDFLNAVVLPKQRKIKDLSYRKNEHIGNTELDFVFSEEELGDKKGNKTKDPLKSEVRHEVKLKNQHHQVFYDKLTFIYLEMPHFVKTENELETTYDKWLYVLKYLPTFTERPQKLQERIFHRLFEAAEIARFTPEEKEQYEESLKSYRDLKNVIDTSFGEGKEEGIKEGKEEGIKQIALNMLKEGLNIDLISKITGLSGDEIGQLF